MPLLIRVQASRTAVVVGRHILSSSSIFLLTDCSPPSERPADSAHVPSALEMTPVISSPETDYGSDFSFKEDNVLSPAAPANSGPESDYGSDFSLDDENVLPQMEPVIPGPESDYGSDFSAGEENALLQLLDNAVSSRHQGLDCSVRTQDALPQAYSETPAGSDSIAASPFPALAPNSLEAQRQSPRPGAEWASIGHAITPAPLRGNSSSAITRRNLHTSPVPTDELSYPDCRSPTTDPRQQEKPSSSGYV